MKKFFLTTTLLAALMLLLLAPHLSAQCLPGQTSLNLTITTDASANETSFALHDLTTGNLLFSPSALQPNSTHNFNLCVPTGNCLKADLYDLAGNGGSSFTIVYQNSTYASAPNFGYLSTALVGPATCTDISPVLDSANYFIQSAGPMSIGNGNMFRGSILGNPNANNVCMGNRNKVTGWLTGNDIALGANNNIGGHKGVEVFLKDHDANCQPFNPIPANQLHVTPAPMANTSDACDPNLDIPQSDEDIYLDGANDEMTINPGHYGQVTVVNGASLFYNGHPVPGNTAQYTFKELTIVGGTMKVGGGGVLCDIFINAENVVIGGGAEVNAIINCEQVEVGNGVKYMGELKANDDGEPLVIGNNNVFSAASCPPCNAAKSGQQGNNHLVPEEFRVWPNPGYGQFMNFSGPKGELEIYDLQGNNVLRKQIGNAGEGAESASLRISTEEMAPGMYIGKLTSRSGRVLNSKFVLLGN